jgi:hypothetical protein
LINAVGERHDLEENSQPIAQLLSVMEGKRTGLALNLVGGGVDQGALQETMLIC